MLNSIDVMGRLTADPELKVTNNQVPVTTFTIACDRDFGEKKADFFNCTAWRGTAEFICKYFHKGNMIAINGRLQTHTWTDKEGNKRTDYEILCNTVYFGERKQSSPDVAFDELEDDMEVPF